MNLDKLIGEKFKDKSGKLFEVTGTEGTKLIWTYSESYMPVPVTQKFEWAIFKGWLENDQFTSLANIDPIKLVEEE